jgi:hypothetical protein
MKKLIAILFMGALLTACGEPSVGVESDDKNDTFVLYFQYDEVERKCDGPNMVYVFYRGISVVPNDPRCLGDTTNG